MADDVMLMDDAEESPDVGGADWAVEELAAGPGPLESAYIETYVAGPATPSTVTFCVNGWPALVITAGAGGGPTRAEFDPAVDADAAARHFIDLVNELFARCGSRP